ncbi:MAG: S41 family peptidase [Bacteroidetes bacterium]|nr:S41 family peptidase [Bacteroidota bacterium]
MKKLIIAILLLFSNAFAINEARLLRFPDIYNDKVVFVYAGDIYEVSSQGGVARRLTSAPGLELFPKFSPDGKRIAFTGQYDGNFNVYVMPSEGGQPRQLTFRQDAGDIPERMGPNDEVITWMPDGKSILFLSRMEAFNTWFGRLFTVSIDGGMPVTFPVPKGGLLSFSPDGSKFAYNRIFRNFRTWKRYDGGLAQDIYIHDIKTMDEERITKWKGTDTDPMWYKDTIYFLSDRDQNRRMNIWSYDLKTKEKKQVTFFKDYDCNWASLGPNAIVFQNGGYLYVLDLPGEKLRKLDISIPNDETLGMPKWVDASKNITNFGIAPDGERAVFEARGDIFTVPKKDGNTRDITNTSGVDDKNPTWSPDGKYIAYVSDRTGEQEIYLREDKPNSEAVQITHGNKAYLYQLVWSPDSKKLLYSDASLNLWYVDVASKEPVHVDKDSIWEITDYSWSPDSRYVTYAKHHENSFTSIYIYSLQDRKIHEVTNGYTNDYDPIFDSEGRYLIFLSDRKYNGVIGSFDMEFTDTKTTGIYVATLQADSASPFAPKNDEVKITGQKPEQAKAGEGKKEARSQNTKAKEVKIDFEGLGSRAVAVPIAAGNIGGLSASPGKIYYITFPTMGLSGNASGEKSALHCYDLVGRKDSELLAPVDGYVLSSDGEKIIYKSGNTYGIIDSKPAEHKVGDGALNLSNMKMFVNFHEEWAEIFNQAWRLERQFFYSPEMNGVDWEAVKKKYEVLLPYVNNRYDLTDVIGEMIGELGNSHTYVGGGYYPEMHKVMSGLLGANYTVDPAGGYYRISKIMIGLNTKSNRQSPLTMPGVNVHVGDYILAINNLPVKFPTSIDSAMENTVGTTVTLLVNSKPDLKGAWTVEVNPIANELDLRYNDWIVRNRELVDKLSDGKIGYVYLPDMEASGLNAFVEQFYPQIRKEGLIVDERYNGGGFIDQMLLERLRRILVGMEMARHGEPNTIPSPVFYGYMACLINQYSASDGDIFPYYFRKYDLGPLIGKRTWGGVRGIRGYRSLVDGGYVTTPEFSLYGLKSEWIIENHGVEPDIEVDQTPKLVMEGQDPQIEAAMKYLLEQIKKEPKKLPPLPPYMPAYPPEH